VSIPESSPVTRSDIHTNQSFSIFSRNFSWYIFPRDYVFPTFVSRREFVRRTKDILCPGIWSLITAIVPFSVSLFHLPHVFGFAQKIFCTTIESTTSCLAILSINKERGSNEIFLSKDIDQLTLWSPFYFQVNLLI